MPHALDPVSHCSQCEIGVASRRAGQHCPMAARERQAGELVYLQGGSALRVWYIKRGCVALAREGDDNHGEGRVRAVRLPRSFIGLEALVGGVYTDSARAITDVTLCGGTLAALDAWLGPRGAPARVALELQLRADRAELPPRAAPDGNAERRVADWLHGEGQSGATLTLPRQIAADLLGMRPETLSRALTALARRGVIRVTRRHIEIVDHDQLAAAAGRVTT